MPSSNTSKVPANSFKHMMCFRRFIFILEAEGAEDVPLAMAKIRNLYHPSKESIDQHVGRRILPWNRQTPSSASCRANRNVQAVSPSKRYLWLWSSIPFHLRHQQQKRMPMMWLENIPAEMTFVLHDHGTMMMMEVKPLPAIERSGGGREDFSLDFDGWQLIGEGKIMRGWLDLKRYSTWSKKIFKSIDYIGT